MTWLGIAVAFLLLLWCSLLFVAFRWRPAGIYLITWKALAVAMRGVRTDGPMAPEIPLDKQRPAEYVFSRHVEKKLAEITENEARTKRASAA